MPTRSTVRAEGRHLTERTGPVRFPVGGGWMGALMREHDWSASSLGPPEGWSPTLRTVVNLVAQSKIAMFIAWGRDLAFLYNDAYAALLGSKHPAALGKPFRDIWGEIWDDIAPMVDRALSGEAVHREHLPLTMRRHGYDEETWFTFSYSPVFDESGAVVGMHCACVETTGQVAAERSLRESRERLEAVAAHAAVGVAQVDLDGRFVLVNDRQCEILGRTREELLRGEVRMLGITHPDDRPGNEELLRRMLRTGEPFAIEKRYLRPDGSAVWAHNHVSLAHDAEGRPRYITALVQDITGRRRAEEALREGEARWRDLFQSMHEAFFVGEVVYAATGEAVDWRYIEVNGAWEKATGIPAGDAVGRLVSEVIPGVERRWIETMARVAETGEPAHVEDRVAAMGRWFEVAAYRTGPGRFAVLFLDTTERRAAQERQALLLREIDHRAKNALAVVQAMLRLTKADDMPTFIKTVEGRVAALARAHTTLANQQWVGSNLRDLVRGELAPFLAGRATADGPEVTLPALAAAPVAMAVHELATNAAKHGALSVPAGSVAVTWRVDDQRLAIRWEESGGPPVPGTPGRRGFGSRLLEATIRQQLRGSVEKTWAEPGLVCDIEMPLDRGEDVEAPDRKSDGITSPPSSSA